MTCRSAYHSRRAGFDEVLAAFGIEGAPSPKLDRMDAWQRVSTLIHNPEGEVTIAVVGKYTGLKDAYKSLIEALSAWRHGQPRSRSGIEWIESEIFEKEDPAPWLEKRAMVSWFPAASASAARRARFCAAKFCSP